MAQEAARAYWRLTVLWLIIGSALGILAALTLLAPEFLSSRPVFGFGRLVAAHRAAMIHGALFSAVFAAGYTLLPRLTQAPVLSRHSSALLAWIGSAIVLAGVISILGGNASGREYADLPMALAFTFWVYLILVAIDISVLLARTRAISPSPATGLLLLAMILPAIVYPFALPGWWGVGLFESLRTWIGWRTIFMGSFVAAALGMGFWILGAGSADNRIGRGSYVIGIGLIAGLGPLMGIVHLLNAPVWPGLKAVGAFAGIMTAAGLVILIRIMWRGGVSSPPALLFLAGLAGIVAAAVQGVLMVIPPVHTAFHFTSNTTAHAHLALGAVLLILLAGGLLAAPRLSRKKLTGSSRAMTGAAWLALGLLLLILAQASAGVLQAAAFSRGLSSPDWLPAFRWLQLGVLTGGLVAFIGAILLGWVILRTLNTPAPDPILSDADPITPESAVEGSES